MIMMIAWSIIIILRILYPHRLTKMQIFLMTTHTKTMAQQDDSSALSRSGNNTVDQKFIALV
jgi:hypothetical protein